MRRRYKDDYLRFLVYALASCHEAMYHLEVLRDTGSAEAATVCGPLAAAEALARQLHRFIESVRVHHRAG